MTGLYYEAPSEESFNDMKRRALDIWNTYDEPYRTEKVDAIKDIGNIKDNFMYMLAMFDGENQRRVIARIHPATRKDVRERMIDGGAGESALMLMGL